MHLRRLIQVGAAAATMLVVAACSSGSGGSPSSPSASGSGGSGASGASGSSASGSSAPIARATGPGTTITVPGDAATITAAVAKAKPGDLILVSPGTYQESVQISVADVTLRGTDRASVILDEQVRRPNGIVVTAPGVTIQNLTVRNATLNGVLITGMSDQDGGIAKGSDGYSTLDPAKFPPIQGFHVDHVTSYNNGLYGIYAFDTQYGLIENTFTSGMADSGIYVGQCKPCNIVVRANVAERNAVGYEGTNASTAMYVIGNRLVGNRVGLTEDSDYQEGLVPQTDAIIAGNLIAANNQIDTPEQADGGFGVGVGIAGGTSNTVTKNRIVSNSVAGLIITSQEDLSPKDNQITANVFGSNALDLAYAPTARGPGSGNCLSGNTLTTTTPANLVTAMSCPAPATAPAAGPYPPSNAPKGIAFTEVIAPPATLPTLADVTTVPAPWAISMLPAIDVASIAVPDASLLQDQSAIRW
jgi:nitrous oxidase accessory protein NosD